MQKNCTFSSFIIVHRWNCIHILLSSSCWCTGRCVHLRSVSGRRGVGPTHRSPDGVAQQGAVLRSAGRPHVRDPDGSSRSKVLPVSGLQEAEPHRSQLHHVPASAHHTEPRPLDPAWRCRPVRHQVDDAAATPKCEEQHSYVWYRRWYCTNWFCYHSHGHRLR